MLNIFGMLCFIVSRKVKTQQRQKKICALYGKGAVAGWTCQELFAKFYGGDFSLYDAPWSGRPVEVDCDQIETLIENSQLREIADTLKISKSIKLLVKMKTVSFYRRN